MTRMQNRAAIVMLALAIQAIIMSPPVGAQAPQIPFRMRAFAVNMTNALTGANGIFEITIERWSTAAERQDLITTMTDKGQDALLSRLRKVPVKGRIRIPGWTGPDPNNYRLGWNLRYTWHEPLPEGGERLMIATDRYMSMWELRNQPRTVDYPFTFVEIRLPPEGKGEGRMAAFAQVSFDKKKNLIELERYSAGQVALNEITVEKR